MCEVTNNFVFRVKFVFVSGKEFSYSMDKISKSSDGLYVDIKEESLSMCLFKVASLHAEDNAECSFNGTLTTMRIPLDRVREMTLARREPRKRKCKKRGSELVEPVKYIDWGFDDPNHPDYDQAMAMANHGYEG